MKPRVTDLYTLLEDLAVCLFHSFMHVLEVKLNPALQNQSHSLTSGVINLTFLNKFCWCRVRTGHLISHTAWVLAGFIIGNSGRGK